MTKTKLQITLEEIDGTIVGRVELPADSLFTLECLNVVVEAVAKHVEMTPDQVMQDLYSIVIGHVVRTKNVHDVCA